MATIHCDKCNAALKPTQKFCSGCGEINDIAFLLLNSESLASKENVEVIEEETIELRITPPQIIAKPTDLDIHQAVVSYTNPYAYWGKLVLDDSAARIWEEKIEREQVCQYQGASFYVSGFQDNIWLVKNRTFSDFAFQAQVRFEEKGGIRPTPSLIQCGLVFRAGDTGIPRYTYTLSANPSDVSEEEGESLTTHVGVDWFLIENFKKHFNRYNQNLLAIVAQGAMIDLYLNLVHIGRMIDYTLNSGSIGVFADAETTGIFTNAKLWVKDDVKDERGQYD